MSVYGWSGAQWPCMSLFWIFEIGGMFSCRHSSRSLSLSGAPLPSDPQQGSRACTEKSTLAVIFSLVFYEAHHRGASSFWRTLAPAGIEFLWEYGQGKCELIHQIVFHQVIMWVRGHFVCVFGCCFNVILDCPCVTIGPQCPLIRVLCSMGSKACGLRWQSWMICIIL